MPKRAGWSRSTGTWKRAITNAPSSSCTTPGAEFPGDPEMAALEELAQQSQARAAEAEQFFKQGQELCAERRFEEAIEALAPRFCHE